MFAKIFQNNKTYISPVLALSSCGWRSQAVVLNEDGSALIVKDILSRAYQTEVLFINFDYGDFAIAEEKIKCLWQEPNIFQLVKKRKYSQAMLDEALERAKRAPTAAFYPLENEHDIEGLLWSVSDFHDAYVLGMQEKDGELELLIDSSWGEFVRLKCRGVERNDLKAGDTFSFCEITRGEQAIEFSFDAFSCVERKLLKAQEICYDVLTEQKLKRKGALHYEVQADGVKIENVEIKFDELNQDILDFKERNCIGYCEEEDYLARCCIFLKDRVIAFKKYYGRRKAPQEGFVQPLREALEGQGWTFDEFPFIDWGDSPIEEELGEVEYEETFHKWNSFLFAFRYVLAVLTVYLLFWLVVQLSNPQMKWTAFLIFGVGMSALTALFSAFLIWKNESLYYFEMREKGIVGYAYGKGIRIDYENVEKVACGKKLTVYALRQKFVFPQLKDKQKVIEILTEKGVEVVDWTKRTLEQSEFHLFANELREDPLLQNIEELDDLSLRLMIHENFVVTLKDRNTYINGKYYYDIEDQDIKTCYRDFVKEEDTVYIQYKKRRFSFLEGFSYFEEIPKNKFKLEKYANKRNVERIFDNRGTLL